MQTSTAPPKQTRKKINNAIIDEVALVQQYGVEGSAAEEVYGFDNEDDDEDLLDDEDEEGIDNFEGF